MVSRSKVSMIYSYPYPGICTNVIETATDCRHFLHASSFSSTLRRRKRKSPGPGPGAPKKLAGDRYPSTNYTVVIRQSYHSIICAFLAIEIRRETVTASNHDEQEKIRQTQVRFCRTIQKYRHYDDSLSGKDIRFGAI